MSLEAPPIPPRCTAAGVWRPSSAGSGDRPGERDTLPSRSPSGRHADDRHRARMTPAAACAAPALPDPRHGGRRLQRPVLVRDLPRQPGRRPLRRGRASPTLTPRSAAPGSRLTRLRRRHCPEGAVDRWLGERHAGRTDRTIDTTRPGAHPSAVVLRAVVADEHGVVPGRCDRGEAAGARSGRRSRGGSRPRRTCHGRTDTPRRPPDRHARRVHRNTPALDHADRRLARRPPVTHVHRPVPDHLRPAAGPARRGNRDGRPGWAFAGRDTCPAATGQAAGKVFATAIHNAYRYDDGDDWARES